ncbi:MAG: hypothetical protein HKN43_05305 [Rhodothermales bacterium]|nr:hypothetical protein [Rhodothermales bacterium]
MSQQRSKVARRRTDNHRRQFQVDLARPFLYMPGILILILVLSSPASAQSFKASSNPSQNATRNSQSLRSALLYEHVEMGSFYLDAQARQESLTTRDDPWLAMDKFQHVVFSFFITTGSQYGLVNKIDLRERNALPFSVGISAAAGLSKEMYDRRSTSGTFSRRDLVADGLGIILAAGLILI